MLYWCDRSLCGHNRFIKRDPWRCDTRPALNRCLITQTTRSTPLGCSFLSTSTGCFSNAIDHQTRADTFDFAVDFASEAKRKHNSFFFVWIPLVKRALDHDNFIENAAPFFLLHIAAAAREISNLGRAGFTSNQVEILRRKFEEKETIVADEAESLAAQLSLTPKQVKMWFKNRRKRNKRKSWLNFDWNRSPNAHQIPICMNLSISFAQFCNLFYPWH